MGRFDFDAGDWSWGWGHGGGGHTEIDEIGQKAESGKQKAESRKQKADQAKHHDPRLCVTLPSVLLEIL